jgi:putative hydrolase of the HAD superfamily
MPRRAAIFDIGGVLAFTDWAAIHARWGARFGVTRQELLNAVFGENDDTILIGRVGEPEWWTEIGRRLRAPAAVPALRDDILGALTWNADLVAFVRSLTGSHPTAILSNAWPSLRPRLPADGHDALVDHVVLSCEVGMRKPHAEIFEATLARLGVAPGDAIFVDDADENIAAATRLGIVGHRYVSTDRAIAALTAFLN